MSSVIEEALSNVETGYQENVPENPADAERVIRQFAQDGYDVIFTTSFGYMDPTINVAADFPDTTFVLVHAGMLDGREPSTVDEWTAGLRRLAGVTREVVLSHLARELGWPLDAAAVLGARLAVAARPRRAPPSPPHPARRRGPTSPATATPPPIRSRRTTSTSSKSRCD